MHPAYSVILFTTASGAGYGLLILAAFTALGHGPASNRAFGIASLAVALGLITLGLLSSTLHLGHPERAWRALSQWRSSWLSREGVAAIATYPAAFLFAAGWLGFTVSPVLLAAAALATVGLCILTLVCTAMIYASLAAVPQWRDPLVVPGYLVMAIATGGVLLSAVAGLFAVDAPALRYLTLAAIVAAAALKLVYWRRIDRATDTFSIEQATGLGRLGKVRQWEVPHTAENFVMKEMGYRVARAHAEKLRRYVVAAFFLGGAAVIAQGLAAGIPARLVGLLSISLAAIAVAVERWLFFAEARHVSTLYYGAKTA
ncbi:MAG: dimethyl sulfoxide reductase anchor subunit [Pseudomonadota bacterium]|nr:dimethyl sulfoxide reductase anchor subunit [Pseudomonadota bacterium]